MARVLSETRFFLRIAGVQAEIFVLHAFFNHGSQVLARKGGRVNKNGFYHDFIPYQLEEGVDEKIFRQ